MRNLDNEEILNISELNGVKVYIDDGGKVRTISLQGETSILYHPSLDDQTNALITENKALKWDNANMGAAIEEEFDFGKPIDLVWLTRDEMKEYSKVQQFGGLNYICADAIDEAATKTRCAMTEGGDEWLCRVDSLEAYANKLRNSNG